LDIILSTHAAVNGVDDTALCFRELKLRFDGSAINTAFRTRSIILRTRIETIEDATTIICPHRDLTVTGDKLILTSHEDTTGGLTS
jgi:hypothetical protein